MATLENKRSHLAMIQGVVNRLSQNSFLLKGWTVVLISALFALAAKESNPLFVYLAYFPAAAFWILDGYFLWQERLYRNLYDFVRVLEEDKINFSMDVENADIAKIKWATAFLSKTLVAFHGVIVLSILIVMLIAIN